MCSNVQHHLCDDDRAVENVRRVRVNEVGSVGIDIFKRTNTAELRRRFESINLLLADGFNHKQICEHLNSEGLDIPYPQYRAIMYSAA